MGGNHSGYIVLRSFCGRGVYYSPGDRFRPPEDMPAFRLGQLVRTRKIRAATAEELVGRPDPADRDTKSTTGDPSAWRSVNATTWTRTATTSNGSVTATVERVGNLFRASAVYDGAGAPAESVHESDGHRKLNDAKAAVDQAIARL